MLKEKPMFQLFSQFSLITGLSIDLINTKASQVSKIEVRVSLNWFRGKYQNNDIIWHVGLSLESLHIILGKSLKYEIETFRRFGKSCFLQTC